ncbi:MAG: hypothetical protein PHU56_00670 [Candidatus Pacebacteria bacterium]|nr:hypothetical protein [Candidatus Paceibacterota bacterium]
MANIFQDKIIKYLTLGLALAAVAMLLQFLLAKPGASPGLQPAVIEALPLDLPEVPAVALDPKNLDNLKIENLQPFEAVDFPARVGRENPFEAYPLVEPTSTATTTSEKSSATSSAPVSGATTSPATTTVTSATTSEF